MKRMFTFLLIALTAFSLQTIAQPGTACNAGFSFTQSGNTVKFIPAVNPDPQLVHHYWNFGDGSPVDTSPEPFHTYYNFGTYTITHYITRINPNNTTTCTDTVRQQIIIPNNLPCTINASFNFERDNIQTNKVYFTNLSTAANNIHAVKWSFGDGTYSDDHNPAHVFPTSGLYNVCLLVKRDSLCASDTCRPVQIQLPTTCNLTVNYSWAADSAQPTKIYFTNLSVPALTAADSVSWTFGDGSSSQSHDLKLAHTYNVPGTYKVCLFIKKANSSNTIYCAKEICQTITVAPPPACNLVAYFSSQPDPTQNTKINFVNQSTPFATGDSIRWTFGDGSSSNDINPTHIYNVPGTYNVCIRVSKLSTGTTGRCVKEFCKVVTILPYCNLIADFKWEINTSQINKINFINLSAPFEQGDSIRWTFGDGTSSNDINPSHIYTAAGTYTVCIRVAKLATNSTTRCVKEICKTIIIQQGCNLQANFEYSKDSIAVNTYHFFNTSIPANNTDSLYWDFGHSTLTSEANPTHVFPGAGTYIVCLYVKRSTISGTIPCESKICKTIIVEQPVCNFEAAYSWKPDAANSKKILFTNNTNIAVTNATTTWVFGDGSTSNTWNATHEYAQPGRYYVCLRIQTSTNCVKYKCDSITVAAPPTECNVNSNFAFTQAATDKQWYTFKPLYQSNDVQYTWTFGDGTGSHDIAVNHRYVQPGIYTACLTVYRGQNCATTTCKEINATTNIYCDSAYVLYQYQHDQTSANKYYFYTLVNVSTSQETWIITKLPAGTATAPVILNQHNPVYTFNDSGYYNVCVRVTTENGCIKEYCNTIYIAPITVSQCGLTAYPNPANSQVSINLQLAQPEMIHAYIYDAQNVLVKQKDQQGNAGNNILTMNTENLVTGFYIIKLVYGNNTCSAKFQKL